jgi:hypothetical protein
VAINRQLITDQDFHEALERQVRVRVFKNDFIVDTGAIIVRFDEQTVVTQTGVSDVAHHSRESCEFYEMKKR